MTETRNPMWRHDLDPDAMTEAERRDKLRYNAAFVFETMPWPPPETTTTEGNR